MDEKTKALSTASEALRQMAVRMDKLRDSSIELSVSQFRIRFAQIPYFPEEGLKNSRHCGLIIWKKGSGETQSSIGSPFSFLYPANKCDHGGICSHQGTGCSQDVSGVEFKGGE